MKRIVFFLPVSILMASVGAWAQSTPAAAANPATLAHAETAPAAITLADALSRARALNPKLQAAVTDAGISREDRVQARAALLPGASYTAGAIYTQPNQLSAVKFIAANGVREYISQGIAQESLSVGSVSDYRRARAAILIGLVLASIIMVLFLRDWGTSLVAGLVIPVTVLVTFIVLKLLDQSFNLMTLGGLAAAVGLVIDDAIVVVENIALHRDAGVGPIQAIRRALDEITVPLIGSTITPIVVFLPLIAVTGVTGVFFRALALTVAASLLTSLGLALVWTPTLSRYFIRGRRE